MVVGFAQRGIVEVDQLKHFVLGVRVLHLVGECAQRLDPIFSRGGVTEQRAKLWAWSVVVNDKGVQEEKEWKLLVLLDPFDCGSPVLAFSGRDVALPLNRGVKILEGMLLESKDRVVVAVGAESVCEPKICIQVTSPGEAAGGVTLFLEDRCK